MKAVVKAAFYRFAPRAAAAVFSARARAHEHRLFEQWGVVATNHELRARFGAAVLGGPFRGLILPDAAWEGLLGPYLMGTYEAELHPWLVRLMAARFPQVVDVGAKFGYYAAGLARHFSGTPVVAFDTDWWARRAVRAAARANDLPNLSVNGYCSPGWLADRLEPGALVVSDCEGFEATLFPGPVGRLRAATLLIETHDVEAPGVTDRLKAAFAGTHACEQVSDGADPPAPPVDLSFLPADRAAQVVCEPRAAGGQRWLLLTPRAGPPEAR